MVKPMLFGETKDLGDLKRNALFQVKYDGERATLHIKNERVIGIFDRREKPVSNLYPELRELQFPGITQAILDGELVVFDELGRSLFYGGIDQRSRGVHEDRLKSHPVVFVCFDAIYLNGNLVSTPYSRRLFLIKASITEKDNFKFAETTTDGEALWKKVIEKDLEGVIIRNPESIYELNMRSKVNLKLKNYKECDVIVEDTEENNKGTKIFGTAMIKGEPVNVECQLQSTFDVEVGSKHRITYLSVTTNADTGRVSLRMPHRTREQREE